MDIVSDFTINMLSSAEDIPGQGVASAFVEQVNLVKNGSKNKYKVVINSKKVHEIQHFHTINYAHYVMLKKNKAINVCYVHFLPHTLDGSIKLPKMLFNMFKKYVVKFYKSADALVVVNPIFIKELMMYGIPKEKISYIPNYVSKDAFFPINEQEKMETKLKYKIPLDKKIVLGVGQVQTRKGILDFVDVAKMNEDIEFVWCGGFSFGNITDGYKQLKKIYDNPPKNVKFLGIVDREDMNNIYNIADVLFMPSYNELFPMAILEAVNSGVPLLLRNLDLYHDILFDKYLSAEYNADFSKKIRQLLDDEQLYAQMQKQSFEISEFYSKENVYQQWEEFYYDIFNKNKEKIDYKKVNKTKTNAINK